jgi:hypothetical protein
MRCTETRVSSRSWTRHIGSFTTRSCDSPTAKSFETRITVTFEATPDRKTLLTLVDAGYPTEEQRDRHESGWPGFLDRFERTVAQVTGGR